ncbi:hypothetical protein [Natronorubrum bangense]|uniref:DUF7988 domain-containing protein n=2 Tax=Natronorubrum bangense TaxID=61858 RepID=L9WJR3_9EURY|nr:hypothetical protein [Natronorubrum bangense]ELY49699.1 hypothetical protein C494_06780 [Natronorubrum bangense JCM 10635]QCC55332.1 hypothetical protein DV706_13175 [Natronorubrum bangense]
MSRPVRDARRRIENEHPDIVAGISHCADHVAEPWDTARTTDSDAVSKRLQSALEATGLLEQLPLVLADVVAAMGYELRAQPVPAPPYVVVTSRGPILRATIEPGRLVVRFDAFEVVRDDDLEQPPAYRRRDGIRLDISLR